MRQSTRRTLTGYGFILPWLGAMAFFIGYPFASSFYFSLCEYPPLRGPLFVGLDNYQELLQDAVFRQSMLVTLIFATVAIPLGVVLALTLALFLNARIRGRSIYRVVYYLPHLVPSVAVAILWMWMFNPQFGILNVLLSPFGRAIAWLLRPFAALRPAFSAEGLLGLVAASFVFWRWVKSRVEDLQPLETTQGLARKLANLSESQATWISRAAGAIFWILLVLAVGSWIRTEDLVKIRAPGWLTDANPFPSGLSIAPSWALWALIYMSLWSVGQMAIIYLAKLQDVPFVLYEVAELDGANWWQKTRSITLPMISPVILFNVIMGIIGAFQVFTEPYIMTGGGPEDRTRFVAMFIYDQAFQYQRLGYGSAVAWVLFLVIIALTMLALRVSREHVYYAAR